MLFQYEADQLRKRLPCLEFRRIVDFVDQQINGKELFCDGFNWLREALVLCDFADYSNASYVCLAAKNNRGSDGVVWIGENAFEVEVTMSKNTRRDICADYLNSNRQLIHMECDGNSKAAELNDLRNSIHDRVSKKIRKTECLLIVFVNHYSLLVADRKKTIQVATEAVTEIQQRRSDVLLRISNEWILIPKPSLG